MGCSAGAQRCIAATAAVGAADDASTCSKSCKVTVATCAASHVYAITSAGSAPSDLVHVLAAWLSLSKTLLVPRLSVGWRMNEWKQQKTGGIKSCRKTTSCSGLMAKANFSGGGGVMFFVPQHRH